MPPQTTSTSLLCLNTGIGHYLSDEDKVNAKIKLKEEIRKASIIFWAELKNPLCGNISEVTTLSQSDSWTGVASIEQVTSRKACRGQSEPKWKSTQQDIALLWNTKVWKEVSSHSSLFDSVNGESASTHHQNTVKLDKVSTRLCYPAHFPKTRVAWTILQQSADEQCAQRSVAFVAFHGIQKDASNTDKIEDLTQIFRFFDERIRQTMEIPVIIGGDFNAVPEKILSLMQDLNIHVEVRLFTTT